MQGSVFCVKKCFLLLPNMGTFATKKLTRSPFIAVSLLQRIGVKYISKLYWYCEGPQNSPPTYSYSIQFSSAIFQKFLSFTTFIMNYKNKS